MKAPDAKPPALPWREATVELVEVGRCLAIIEVMLRELRATAAVEDGQARSALAEAYAAARRLVSALDALRRQGED